MKTREIEMEFIKLTEDNTWEGEQWYFWLQADGNEAELEKLRALLEPTDEDDDESVAYTLGAETLSESEVDLLVKYGGSGYRAYHNKVTGVFTCPESLGLQENDILYKGGIEDLFVKNHE